MNFPSIARFAARPVVAGLSGSMLVHAGVTGVIAYLLFALPQVWELNVRRGEAVVLQAQMTSVAAAQPIPVTEVEISAETVPLEPPPSIAVDHAPVRETTEAIPVAIPLARAGEYEPTEPVSQPKPPETPQQVVSESKVTSREKRPMQSPPKPVPEVAKTPPRQVADQLVIAQSNITVAAIAPAEAGAQVDELPKLMPFNREPNYPLDALYAGREGRVVLLVKINSLGRAAEVRVATSSGTPSLDASAITAVRDWQFSPARRKGTPVIHEALVPVNFRIRGG